MWEKLGVPGFGGGRDLPDARLRSGLSWQPRAARISSSASSTECAAVASAEDHPPRAPSLTRTRGMLTAEGSPITASMFRDIKAGAPVEADHVIGDLIARGERAKVPVPKLRTAYTHLKVYEQLRG